MTLDGAHYLWGTIGADLSVLRRRRDGPGAVPFRLARGEGRAPAGFGIGLRRRLPLGARGDRGLGPRPSGQRDQECRRHRSRGPGSSAISSWRSRRTPKRPGRRMRAKSITTIPGLTPMPSSATRGSGPRRRSSPTRPGLPTPWSRRSRWIRRGDASVRQTMAVVEYPDAPARPYSSQYEIDLWTNPARSYVYPHLVNKDKKALKGTDYLADDPVLYNLTDKKTYEEFLARVAGHIQGQVRRSGRHGQRLLGGPEHRRIHPGQLLLSQPAEAGPGGRRLQPRPLRRQSRQPEDRAVEPSLRQDADHRLLRDERHGLGRAPLHRHRGPLAGDRDAPRPLRRGTRMPTGSWIRANRPR